MQQKGDPLFQVEQTIVKTSESDVALPMLFYDATFLLSLFHVDAEKLVEVIDVDSMAP